MSEFDIGYVTFMDILGWRGIWQKKGITPLKSMNNILKRVEEEQSIVLYKTNEILKNELAISKIYFEKMYVQLNLSLISDTFVLTTTVIDNADNENYRGKDDFDLTLLSRFKERLKEIEINVHGQIVKKILLECINEKMLIRGATSYGKYKHSKNSFLGPAIDEAASWHETAEMVTVFMTPSAKVSSDKNLLDDSIWEFYKPKLKLQDYDTYCINWKDSYSLEKFQNEVMKDNSPLIPAISYKYLNTEEYLK